MKMTTTRDAQQLPLSRRDAMALMGAILPLAGLASTRAKAADRLTVRLEWSAYVMHLPFHLAAEKGWFKAADLDVYLEDGNGSVTTVQLVGNERFDLGHAALAPMAVGASRGLAITSISQYLQKSPLGIIYAQDAGINALKDFAGKKLLYTPGSLETPFLEPFFAQNKVQAGSINLIGVEASAKLSSYAVGTADAVVATVPADMPHVEDKRPSKSLLFADFGMDLPTFGLIANAEALKTKGPAIKRFASIVSAAWAYVLDGHVAEAAEAVMKQRPGAPTSVATLVEEFKRYGPFFGDRKQGSYPGPQDKAAWAKAIREMELAKVIPAGTTPEKYFTNDYIDVAFGGYIIASK
jgi:NitT/TauT family transport system substrate-binding protein